MNGKSPRSKSVANLKGKDTSQEKDKKEKGKDIPESDKEKSEKKKIDKQSLPININNYKHLIDTLLLTGKDIEWVLQLRGYKNFTIADKDESSKNAANQVPPSFYQKDYDHYMESKELLNKKASYTFWNHTGNSNNFEHLMSRRVGEKSNPSLLAYETSLRLFPPKCTLTGPKEQWLPPPNVAKSETLIPKFLPPLLKMSEKNLERLKAVPNSTITRTDKKIETVDLITRPLDKVYHDDVTADPKQTKVKNRKFLKSKTETLALLGENNSMKPYSLSYSIKNINNFKHFFDGNNNSYAVWGADLRSHVTTIGKTGKVRKGSFETEYHDDKPESIIRKERRDRIEKHYKLK